MRLGPVTKLDKRDKKTSKKIDNDVKSENCDVIAIFRIFQFRGWIPDTKSAKFMFSVMITFCLTKTENRTKKSLTQLSHYCFE